MKFLVNFDDKELVIENDGPIKVLDLTNYLKNQLKIGNEKQLKLYTNEQNYLSDLYILKEDDVKNWNLNLISLDRYKIMKDINKEIKLVDLIAEVTNASQKMEIIENQGKNISGASLPSINLDTIMSLLNSEQLGNAPVEIRDQLLNFLRLQGGDQSERDSQMESSRSNNPIILTQPAPELVSQLQEMGFPEDRCRKVLIYTNNDINAAMEFLLSDQDIDLPDCNN